MARIKSKPLAFGASNTNNVAITNAAGTTNTITAVIEELPADKSAEIIEMKDGQGDVDGLIVKNDRTEVSINFYVTESTIAAAEADQNAVVEVGDKVVITEADMNEISGVNFIVSRVGKMHRSGENRKFKLDLVKYANDVSAEATAS